MSQECRQTYESFQSNELRLGLFLLEANIFYKDHQHQAPELYINLTDNTLWRFGNSNWERKNAGSIIYNTGGRRRMQK